MSTSKGHDVTSHSQINYVGKLVSRQKVVNWPCLPACSMLMIKARAEQLNRDCHPFSNHSTITADSAVNATDGHSVQHVISERHT